MPASVVNNKVVMEIEGNESKEKLDNLEIKFKKPTVEKSKIQQNMDNNDDKNAIFNMDSYNNYEFNFNSPECDKESKNTQNNKMNFEFMNFADDDDNSFHFVF